MLIFGLVGTRLIILCCYVRCTRAGRTRRRNSPGHTPPAAAALFRRLTGEILSGKHAGADRLKNNLPDVEKPLRCTSWNFNRLNPSRPPAQYCPLFDFLRVFPENRRIPCRRRSLCVNTATAHSFSSLFFPPPPTKLLLNSNSIGVAWKTCPKCTVFSIFLMRFYARRPTRGTTIARWFNINFDCNFRARKVALLRNNGIGR